MNEIWEWLKNNVHKAVGVSVLLNLAQLLPMLVQYASDGVIDENELHQLLTASSGVNQVILIALYAYLKVKAGKK